MLGKGGNVYIRVCEPGEPHGCLEPKVLTLSDESGGPGALGMKPREARVPLCSPQGHKRSRGCLPSLCGRGH